MDLLNKTLLCPKNYSLPFLLLAPTPKNHYTRRDFVKGLVRKVSRAALQVTRSTVQRWFTIQGIVVIVVTLAALILGKIEAGSVLIGGIICIVPTAVFARWWFAYYKADDMKQLVKVFYLGELLKLALIGIMFVVFLYLFPIQILWCLAGYMSAQVAFWLAPLLVKN